MKRSTFLMVSAVLALIFGSMMLLAPAAASEGFGMSGSAETLLLFRSVGAMILSSGVLNFLVRNHPDSVTMGSVLLFNIVYHVLVFGVDMACGLSGIVEFTKVIPGLATHIFIGTGSLIYYRRIRS